MNLSQTTCIIMTPSPTIINILKLSMMAFNKMTFSKMTFSIKTVSNVLSILLLTVTILTIVDCRYAERLSLCQVL
jgi:hypothetical protein